MHESDGPITLLRDVDTMNAQVGVAALLDALLGDDWRTDENLTGTPVRVGEFYLDFLRYSDDNIDTTFDSLIADQLIAATGIRVWSICAHHLLPFWCDVNMGYLAKDSLLGVSKLARIAKLHGHKLQLQERLVVDIADHLEELIGRDVAVTAAGEHLCMTMRGIETEATIHSQVMRGAFLSNPQTRNEFLRL